MRSAARASIAAALAAMACAACAAGSDNGPPGDPRAFGGSQAPGEGPHLGRADLNVFISPSGEPFHGGRDDPYASAAWFARADADHDGKLTRAEFRADAQRAFALFDTNGDGVIDGFEIQHYEQATAPEILPRIDGLRAGEGMDDSLFKTHGSGRGRGGQDSGGGRPRRQVATDREVQGGGLYAMLAEPEPLTAADADLSGTVSKAEWMARTERRFDLLDTAGRGYLTLDTLPKTQVQLLIERRRAREAAAHHAPPPR